MMVSRILAVLILVGATLWIGSGVLGRTEAPDAAEAPAAAEQPLFRVAVIEALPESHARKIVLSGRTEADNRASAVARASGSLLELNVRRGDRVAEREVIATLSDEAREARVSEAAALVQQRRADLEARMTLIERGVIAANERNQLEADLRAAEAALAVAEAEQERGQIRAPIAGVVASLPVRAGQAVEPGAVIAEIVALDPMLAVVEVAERQLAGIRPGDRADVRLVTGAHSAGTIRFISPSASEGTRTYRVDVEIPNSDAGIPDGVTAEVAFTLAPVDAVRVPRSALTFSAEGELSVRLVDAAGTVRSTPVTIIDDEAGQMWVAGPEKGALLIVQGQDFVKDGQKVEPVLAPAAAAPIARN